MLWQHWGNFHLSRTHTLLWSHTEPIADCWAPDEGYRWPRPKGIELVKGWVCSHLVSHRLGPDGVLSRQGGAAEQDEEQDEVGEPGGIDDTVAQDPDPGVEGRRAVSYWGLGSVSTGTMVSSSQSVEGDNREDTWGSALASSLTSFCLPPYIHFCK